MELGGVDVQQTLGRMNEGTKENLGVGVGGQSRQEPSLGEGDGMWGRLEGRSCCYEPQKQGIPIRQLF